MCGITGLFEKPNDLKTVRTNDLEGMLSVASRRGPEQTSSVEVNGGAVGHTLLAFVNQGNNPQPYKEDGSTIVYNGEVYNWRDLNQEYNLGAENDTQVLLRGIQKHGAEFLDEIDGQFAFILNKDGETMVGRDLYGISPLVFGKTLEGQLALASTPEALKQSGVQKVKTVPGGSYGMIKDGELELDYWHQLPADAEQLPASPVYVRERAKASVVARIPTEQQILFTAMGGIDSQFITATTARATNGNFGGAITVVPWDPKNPDDLTGGDYHEARATVEMLREEGININHHVVQLTPDYIKGAIYRVIKVLGPDYFNVACGLAEDLVATTAIKNGGKAIMTAGGPDESGRSYKPWTKMHKDCLEEGFYAIGDQFSSAEGVRAGLVFGEQGLENRVPLAHMIEDSLYIRPEDKQEVEDWGDGKDPFTIKMKDKIYWREAVSTELPEKSLSAPKATIHGASGSKPALQQVVREDNQYQTERQEFLLEAQKLGYETIVYGNMAKLDPNSLITEGQAYCLWKWKQLDPDEYYKGSDARYGSHESGVPRYSSDLQAKIDRPVCYDWMAAESVKLGEAA